MGQKVWQSLIWNRKYGISLEGNLKFDGVPYVNAKISALLTIRIGGEETALQKCRNEWKKERDEGSVCFTENE